MKKIKKIVQKSAVAFCALTVGATTLFAGGSEWLKADAVGQNADVWTTYSTYNVAQDPAELTAARVTPPTRLSEGTNTKLSVLMGQNEIEGAQLLLTAKTDNVEYNLKANDLKLVGGTNDDIIPATDIKLYKQCYTYANHGRTDSSCQFISVGYVPDMLLPLETAVAYKENFIKKGQNQGLSVEVYTKGTTKAGVYKGNLTLTVNGATQDVPLEVEVRAVNLEKSYVGVTAASASLMEETYEMLMNDYRVLCQFTPKGAYNPETMIASLEEYWDNPHFTNYELPNDTVQRFGTYLERIALASKPGCNYLERAICYIQSLDETNNGLTGYNGVKPYYDKKVEVCNLVRSKITEKHGADFAEEVCNAIMKVVTYVPINNWIRSTTAYDWHASGDKSKDFKSIEGTYCTSMYSIGKGEEAMIYEYAQESASPIWTYANSAGGVNGVINHALPSNGEAMRYFGWTAAKNDMGGLLFWDMDAYRNLMNANHELETYTPVEYYEDSLVFGSAGYGDGNHIYPAKKYGDPDGWFASLRLKNLRDGIEDHSLLTELEKAYTADEYAKYGIDPSTDFDTIMNWLYKRGLNTPSSFTVDDGTVMSELKKAIFDLYSASQSESNLLIENVDISGTTAKVTFYTTVANNVKVNGTAVTNKTTAGSGYKYTYSWNIANAGGTVMKIEAGDTTFQTKVYDFTAPQNALASLTSENVADYVSSSKVAGDKKEIPAGTVALANGVLKISVTQGTKPSGWNDEDGEFTNTGYIPKFTLKAGLFGTDDIFDLETISMTIRVKFKTTPPKAGNGQTKVPLHIALGRNDIATEMDYMILSDETCNITQDGWYERKLTFKPIRVNMKTPDSLIFLFQSYHGNFYNMGADIEITDLWYSKKA